MIKKLIKGATVETKDKTIESAVAVYFDVVEEHSISLQSQITDNWLENNQAVNDYIANQPIVVSLRGLSGELVYEPSTSSGILNEISNGLKNRLGTSMVNKLSVIPALYPPVSNITRLAQNAVVAVESSFNRYKKIINRFTSTTTQQQRLRKIYQDFSTLRENKTPLMVQTPFSTFDNMYIQSLTLRQTNQLYIADIELSLKQLNFTDSEYTKPTEDTRSKCNFLQRDTVEDHGKTQGQDVQLGGVDGDDGNGNYVFKLYVEENTTVYD